MAKPVRNSIVYDRLKIMKITVQWLHIGYYTIKITYQSLFWHYSLCIHPLNFVWGAWIFYRVSILIGTSARTHLFQVRSSQNRNFWVRDQFLRSEEISNFPFPFSFYRRDNLNSKNLSKLKRLYPSLKPH